MDVTLGDSDDSSLFLKSIGQKRKALTGINHKNCKQAKLNFPQPTTSQNAQTNHVSEGNGTGENDLLEDEEKGELKSSSKSLEKDLELNESISSYFDEKKYSNTCPLCLKRFETDSSYATHMKQCAKKRKMTTQQLLSALALQKKQMKERKALGLPSQVVAPKKTIPKKKVKEDSESDYDLALGLALSKSLDPSESKTEVQNATLKEFGFTYSGPGPSKKKNKDSRKWTLKERTQEERQRIVTEKAAVVLLDEDKDENSGNFVSNRNSFCENGSLTKFQNRVPRLWNLGESDSNLEWYVSDIKELIKIEEENERKEEEVEKEDGKNVEEKKEGKEERKMEEEEKEKEENVEKEKRVEEKEEEEKEVRKKEEGEENGEKEKREEMKEKKQEEEEVEKGETNGRLSFVTDETLTRQIRKLKLPREGIHLDWKKMVNSERFSDLLGRTKDSEEVYMHSIVFYVRCPDILEKDHKFIFSKFSLSTVLVFLEYLYCGTLNGLTVGEIENLSKLALDLDYKELTNVLNSLESDLSRVENSEGIIPSSLTPDEDSRPEDGIIFVEEKAKQIEEGEEEEVTIVPDEKDLFAEEMVDLTQSHQGSPSSNNDKDGDEVDVSLWNFAEQEKRREELEEEMRRKEEEMENSLISEEMEKIETSMKKRNEMMEKMLNEFENDKSDFKTDLELEGGRSGSGRRSGNSKDMFEERKEDDCIVLSSDSETRTSKGGGDEEEEEEGKDRDVVAFIPSPEANFCAYEVPYFDPYENYSNFSNPVSPVYHDDQLMSHSQSMVSGVPLISPPCIKRQHEISGNCKGPEHFSTPISRRQTFSEVSPSPNESMERRQKRKSALGASQIIRKSLGLDRMRKSSSAKKLPKKRKRRKSEKEKDLSKILSSSVLNELSNSFKVRTSTPAQNNFVEITPRTTRSMDISESVTPSPNFSNMTESMLKEHLSKYGLKKRMAKTKAKKILRHIYEELHPILNTKTGKFVKILPSEETKGGKKAKPKKTVKKSNSTKKSSAIPTDLERATTNRENVNESLEDKDPDQKSDGSVDSFDRSTDYDSDGSEYEKVHEPLTQSVANNPLDLPTAFTEFLQRNPEFHQKILFYEPIWLEELQREMKQAFQKHFKLSDLMEFLDQKCITFRTEAQKKRIQKKNEKKSKVKESRGKKTVSVGAE